MKQKHIFKTLLTLLLLLGGGQNTWATSTFSVTTPNNDNTFRITRTGNTALGDTVDWRVVSLSAIAGQHFTGYNGSYHGTVYFGPNETYKDITISESTPSSSYFRYQTGTERKYRFEVLDKDGYIMASTDRSITTGNRVTSSGLFDVKTGTISSNEFVVTDGGYNQSGSPRTINRTAFYNNNEKNYISLISAQLRMILEFEAKEKSDGYQYLQILTDNTTGYDSENAADGGNPGTPSLSRYMAGFEIYKSGKYETYKTYTFPVTSVGHDAGAVDPWGYDPTNHKFPLSKQKFYNAGTGTRASDGKLIIPNNFSSISVRFDASGSDNDDWYVKNLKAKITAVDNTAPLVITDKYKVSEGRHQKGNIIYVSVPFNEIVKVTGTPTLNTNWGNFAYEEGNGSNVLTFKGEIRSSATGQLKITGMSTSSTNTVKDLAGNGFSAPWSTNNPYVLGTVLDPDYDWSIKDFRQLVENNYEIYTKMDLRHLALMVNKYNNKCDGLTFKQTANTINCDDSYIPIGLNENACFRGTYDGQGNTINGITVNRTDDGNIGLFGYLKDGTVKDVVLESCTFAGKDNVGGIVGYNTAGTIRNCRVEGSVLINSVADGTRSHGGIAGNNDGNIIGCLSDAKIQRNSKSNLSNYGGIAGSNAGSIQDCLFTGNTVVCDDSKGAIAGRNNGTPIYTNNYYTYNIGGGVAGSDCDGARFAYSVTLGEDVALVGDETAYSASGLTAVGTGNYALRKGSTLYSGATQNLTFNYTGVPATGYVFDGFSATNNGTFSGNTLTMPASSITVTVAFRDVWGVTNTPAADGTEAHPYLISDTTGLNLLARNVNGTHGYTANKFQNKHFMLANNITYSTEGLGENESNYTAIGLNQSIHFDGTFDGDNDTISGIRIYKSNEDFQGLFGWIQGNNSSNCGAVKRVVVKDAVIHGRQNVGGIAGYVSSDLEHCLVLGSTISGSNYVGAILGYKTSLGYQFYRNYYRGCTVNGTANATHVGTGSGDFPGSASSLHTLSLGDNISATGSETEDIGAVTYYANASTITLSYSGTVPLGYALAFQYNDGSTHTVTRDEDGYHFTMPAADISVNTTFIDVWGLTNNPAADGSAEHPYLISDTVGLNVLAKCVNGTDGYTANSFSGKCFKLADNITYSTTGLGENESNYTAIGTNDKKFCGTFDGNGDTISGIRIIRPHDEYQGLFGWIISGTVKNFALTDARITGGKYTGGIVGQLEGSTCENCHVANNVNVHSSSRTPVNYHGGITGIMNNNSTIRGCTCAASITNVSNNVRGYGGIIGYVSSGTVKDCLFTGYVGLGHGAIAGKNDDSLTNNYYTSNNNGGVNESDVDGARRARTLTLGEGLTLVGNTTAYSLSGLTAIGTSVLSYNDGSATTLFSGMTQTVSLSYTGAPMPEGYTLVVTYNDGSDHIITPTDGVYSFVMPAADVSVTATWQVIPWSGSGTEEAPYIISYPSQLDLLAERVNSGTGDDYAANGYSGKFFRLGNDITYSHTTDWDDASSMENNYTAIGTSNPFRGTFDGCGHTVSGIRIHKASDDNQGLFGYLVGARVKNVIVADAHITGRQAVGGIAGNLYNDYNDAIIDSCVSFDVAVKANSSYCGGIIGNLNDCYIFHSLAIDAMVSGSRYKGAVVGGSARYTRCFESCCYYNCTVGGVSNATGVGCDGSDDYNAYRLVPASRLTIEGDVTASGCGIPYDGNFYFARNSTVTLGYSGAVAADQVVVYSVGGNELPLNSFSVTADTAVTATVVSAILSVPYSYDFETESPFRYWKPVTGDYTIDQSLFFAGTTSNLMLLPLFDVEANTLKLSMQLRAEGKYENCGTFSVGYVTDAGDAGTFTPVATYSYAESQGHWIEKTEYFAGIPAGARLALRSNPLRNGYYWFVDDIEVAVAPSCIPSQNLTLTGYDSTRASFAWRAVEGALWEYSLLDSDREPDDADFTTTTANSVSFDNLIPITSYRFHLRRRCDAQSTSAIDTLAFTTTAPVPFADGFEGARCRWTVGGSIINRWCQGNAVNNGGSHSLYISDDGGTSRHNTSDGSSSISYAYIRLSLAADYYNFSYDWTADCGGDIFLRVALVPDNISLENNYNISSYLCGNNPPSRWRWLDGNKYLRYEEDWATRSEVVEVPAAGLYKMVFFWYNNDDEEYPAAVDNVQVTIPRNFTTAGRWNEATNWSPAGVPTANERVIVRAPATIPSGCVAVADKIILADDGSLTLADGGQLYTHNEWNETIPITVEKEVRAGEWNALTTIGYNNIANFTTAAYDLFSYDEEHATWENEKDRYMSGPTGYIYRRGGDATLSYNTTISYSNHIIYRRYGDDALKGFNLVGNNMTHNVVKGSGIRLRDENDSWATGYYTLEAEGSWRVHPDSDPIAPGQAFLVELTRAEKYDDYAMLRYDNDADWPSATSKGTHSSVSPKRADSSPNLGEQLRMMFTVSDGRHSDVAYALFGEGEGLRKFGHQNADLPSLSIVEGEGRYAIAPIAEGVESFDLAFRGKAGEYNLSVKNEELRIKNYVHLIDRLTGADVDLLRDSTYTFKHSSNQAIANRFLVRFSPLTSHLSPSEVRFAHMEGEEVVVSGEGTLTAYDVMGRELFRKEIKNEELRMKNSDFPGTGVYILNLNGYSQKIVFK